ncbi:MAG: zinc-dependent metalloprotease [Phycisphaerales bacterium]
MRTRCSAALIMAAGLALAAAPALAQGGRNNGQDFPPFDQTIDGYEKVTGQDGSLWTLYVRERDAQVLAELPRNFESQRLFIYGMVAEGNPLAGVGGIGNDNENFCKWQRIGNRLALVSPELEYRTTGDAESRRSVEMMYTDQVLLSVPIVTMGPGGGPVIDLDGLFLGQASRFFGGAASGLDISLARVSKTRAFPNNLIVGFRAPMNTASRNPFGGPSLGGGARFTELLYTIQVLPENTGYRPRAGDPRMGYFGTAFNDLSRTVRDEDTWVRYITRWNIQKADPNLAMSPPREPLVWYIEHTVPIRYRRYVREGVLEWNKAFERVGIANAIEVRQQDAATGAYMDLDPEDARYNFVRWNDNQQTFAIGPSRADPLTGEIFDADLTINTGIFAAMARWYGNLMPAIATEGFTPETMAWLDQNPQWDPRVGLAAPGIRESILAERAARAARGEAVDYTRIPIGEAAMMMGALTDAGVANPEAAHASYCMAGVYAAMGTDLMRLLVAASPQADSGTAMLDSLPEEYAGQMLRGLTAHETGHCLGLAHNFMASTIRTAEEINSGEYPADQAIGGSVMEYTEPNFNYNNLLGPAQGQYTIHQLGPWDYWVIEYGYTFDNNRLEEILDRNTEPDLIYGSNIHQSGSDPRVRTYDFGTNPLDLCDVRMTMVQDLRAKIISDLVDDNEGWGRARDIYQTLLSTHLRAVSTAAAWVGGSYISNAHKGDPNAPEAPVMDIPAEQQRRALAFVIEHALQDDAFGLTPELIAHLSVDKGYDQSYASRGADPAYNVHDTVSGVQTSALTMLINPSRLRTIYDNEFRSNGHSQDTLTMAEVVSTVTDSVWGELDVLPTRAFTASEPYISSLRRNLQGQMADRLIAMAQPGAMTGSAAQPLRSLCRMELRELSEKINGALTRGGANLDPYSRAHLSDVAVRIERALEAQQVYAP